MVGESHGCEVAGMGWPWRLLLVQARRSPLERCLGWLSLLGAVGTGK